jgi:FG-GAP-like repeat/IPT/TIG domain/FG-GAP repeat
MPFSKPAFVNCVSNILVFCSIFGSLAANAQPQISQFSPVSGPVGTTVTITGAGFGATAASNIVFFGATRATVSAVSTSSLTVTVPAGATYQPISVTVNSLTAWAAAPFIVTFPGGQPFAQAAGSMQQDVFEPAVDSPTGLHPNGVAIADFDGDGKPDIATANNFVTAGQSGSISLLRNTGAIGHIAFASHYDMPTSVQTYAIAAGDLDGDGKPDLVSCGLYNQTISIFRNTSTPGAISFASEIDYPSGHEPFSIAIADIDLDGRPDIIVANNLGGTVSIYRNTTTGGVISFASSVDIAVGLEPQCLAVGDFDGDGKTDIVVTNQGGNTISVLLNQSTVGSISFPTRTDIATNTSPYGVAVGDLDGDNKPDIVVVNNGANNFSVFRNTCTPGSVSFAPRIDQFCGVGPYAVALADLNGDGKTDIFISTFGSSVIQNASTPGTIAFGTEVYLGSMLVSFGIGIADFDGDGKSDLVAPLFDFEGVGLLRNKDNEPTIISFSPINAVAGTVDTIIGHHFDGVTGVSFGGVPAASYIIVNPDTILATVGTGASGSIGVTNQYGTNYLAGFYFHVPPVITSFTPVNAGANDTIEIYGSSFTSATAVTFGGMPAASWVVNSDTSITAIIDTGATGAIQVITPYGTGTLAGFTYYRLPVITNFTPGAGGTGTTVTITGANFVGITAVTIGGVPAASFSVNSSTGITAVIGEGANGYIAVTSPGGTGLSDTTFAFPPPVINAISTDSAAVGASVIITGANFRSDPSADIVYFGAAKAVVTSASTTSLTVTVPPGTTYAPVTVAVNNRVASTVRPFIATYAPGATPLTDSSFGFRGAFAVSENPEQIALADLDGDGKPDIISADYEEGIVSILQNNSSINNPSFTNVIYLPSVSGGSVLYPVMTVGDLNGDGKPDLVIASYGAFSVYINTSSVGAISFAPVQNFLVPSYEIEGIVLADFDGDGRTDIAMTTQVFNATGNGFSVYRNIGDVSKLAFAPSVDFSTGDIGFQISAADLDNDGRPDIVTVVDNNIEVYRNTGSIGTIAFSPAGTYPVNLSQKFAIADVDGDGLQDLISAGAGGQQDTYVFSVYKNTSTVGNISFGTRIDSTFGLPTGIDYLNPTTGQIDGDGKPDLVLAGTNPLNVNEQAFLVFRNTGQYTGFPFTGGLQYPSPVTFAYVSQTLIGDVDGDGKADIIVANDVENVVSIFRNQSGERSLSICVNSDTAITEERPGSVYQWQVATGGAYSNLTDNGNYSGSGSSALRLISIPAGFSYYQYRCLVDGVPGTITDLFVNPDTVLAGTAFAPAHACTDYVATVIFYGAANLPVNSSVQLWSSIDSTPYQLLAQQPYAGSMLAFSVRDSAASGISYYFNILPPAGVSACTIGAYSDTVTTAITNLAKPQIDLTGNILQITNADTSESYTWQRLDSSGVWQTGLSAVTTDTLLQSGTYRVEAAKSTCAVISDSITYMKPVVTSTSPSDSSAIRAYPNPANTVFIIDSLNLADGWSTVEIIDAQSGRRISITSIEGRTLVVLDVGSLSKGIYLAILRRNTGGNITIKFLKL